MSTLVAIRCPRHGATMEKTEARTPEQAFCGAWWRCTQQCGHTVLFESPALRQQWWDSLSRTDYRSNAGRQVEAYLAQGDQPHG